MSVRVYVPLTSSGLAAVVASGRLAGPFRAHSVTDALRAEWPDGDEEAWEYAATYAAADDSYALAGEGDRRRRYVLAADVPEGTVGPVTSADGAPTLVDVSADVPWKRIAAVHADTDDVGPGDLDDVELAWFATQEIGDLVP